MIMLQFIAQTLEFIGTIFISFTALRVHQRLLVERRIDKKVVASIRFEQIVGFTGVACLTTGYILLLISYYFA